MPRTWDRSRFAPWLLRELVQVNEEPTSRHSLRTPELSAGERRHASNGATKSDEQPAIEPSAPNDLFGCAPHVKHLLLPLDNGIIRAIFSGIIIDG
jgi:hypothetical protein